jgi:hypothetical protein
MTFNQLADRYVAVWNDPDPESRRRQIAELWTENGANLTDSLEARGHEALAARIEQSHNKWVRDAGMVFRSRGNATGHHNAVKFSWDMAPAGGGGPVSTGFDFLILAADGRIVDDYQFTESLSPSVDRREGATSDSQTFTSVISTEDGGSSFSGGR